MRILAIGDVCGELGVELVRRRLGALRRDCGADLCIVNGENASLRGLSAGDAEVLLAAGADVVTLGNHAFDDRRILDALDERADLVRPYNLPPSLPGRGYAVLDCGGARVCVAALLGRLHMGYHPSSPFDAADELLRTVQAEVFVFDFHAEATSEKQALAHYLDGRAAVVFGTHTHVPTADGRPLPGGTGYQTDLGMTGGVDSVIGVKKEQSIAQFRRLLSPRFESAVLDGRIMGALFTLEGGRCTAVERVERS